MQCPTFPLLSPLVATRHEKQLPVIRAKCHAMKLWHDFNVQMCKQLICILMQKILSDTIVPDLVHFIRHFGQFWFKTVIT